MFRHGWLAGSLIVSACAPGTGGDGGTGLDPDDAEVVEIDRFSATAATMFVRDDANGLPGPNEPIDFDAGFLNQGFGPDGQVARYYSLDVRPLEPLPAYVLYREGEDTPVEGQLPVIDAIPGEQGYNDFWQVYRVTVPADYEANTVTSVAAIVGGELAFEATEQVLNRPLVPAGSTASLAPGGGPVALGRAWVGDRVAWLLEFDEAPIPLIGGNVHYSEIYVCFNIKPGEPGGGPASGFCDEGDGQTHNILGTVPGDAAYSPLWSVSVYDIADFDAVVDLASIAGIDLVASMIAMVNCPVASVETP